MKNGIHLEIDFLKHFSKKNYLEGKLEEIKVTSSVIFFI